MTHISAQKKRVVGFMTYISAQKKWVAGFMSYISAQKKRVAGFMTCISAQKKWGSLLVFFFVEYKGMCIFAPKQERRNGL